MNDLISNLGDIFELANNAAKFTKEIIEITTGAYNSTALSEFFRG